MICERCNVNKATVRVESVINNVKKTIFLCNECSTAFEGNISVDNLLKGLLHSPPNEEVAHKNEEQRRFKGENQDINKIQKSKPVKITKTINLGNQAKVNRRVYVSDKKCPMCGIDYAGFQNTGKLGCVKCFEAFKPELMTVIKKVQGNVKHEGKFPVKFGATLSKTKEIDKLKVEIEKAIKEEEYEMAATIRDKIKALKLELENEEKLGKEDSCEQQN